ncbi:MAG: hypothetical protein LRY28_03915 [Erysipelotrichaceae bacterium]|nr:hypothetical protein [Erysipelotrichaceae bacterium]
MKIGFIVHSQSGNTLSVAQKLMDQLKLQGHDVMLTHIKDEDVNVSMQHPERFIKVVDEVTSYVDVLFIGGWVQAFILCRGLNHYINHQLNIQAKETHLFLTHHFPFEWMGGTNAMKQLTKHVIAKEHVIKTTKIFNWSRKNNQQHIDQWIESMITHINALV